MDQSTQSIQSVLGDKLRQVGDKPEIMRSENPECFWQETKPRDKRKIMRAKHAPLSKE